MKSGRKVGVAMMGLASLGAIGLMVSSLLGIDLFGTTQRASEEAEVEQPICLLGEVLTNYSDIQYTLDGRLDGYLVFGMVSDTGGRYAVEVGPDGNITWAFRVHPNRDVEHVSDVRKLESGNYLLLVEQNGIYEITKEGEIVWYFLTSGASIQSEPLENGNILTLDVPARAREITRDGGIVWEWNPHNYIHSYSEGNYVGWEEHSQGGQGLGNMYAEYREPEQGWTHLNTVQKLEDGHHLLCLRNFDLVVELDENNEVVWTYGALVLKHPHTPVRLENGNTLIYDNGNGRVIEVTRDHEIVWEYGGLASAIGGACQRLLNGNTVITDTLQMRVLCVTPSKDIVWDLVVTNISPGRPAIWRGVFYLEGG